MKILKIPLKNNINKYLKYPINPYPSIPNRDVFKQFKYIFIFKYFIFFRTQPTILNELWANVDRIIVKMQRSRIPVPEMDFASYH